MYLRLDVDISSNWAFSYRRSESLTTNFARKRVQTPYLSLFRAINNSVVICKASLLYELGYPFRSTLFVPTDFQNIFRPIFSWFFFEKSCCQYQTQEVSSNQGGFEWFFRKLTCQFKIVATCAKSIFVFSGRNMNIFWRILIQFTGLLRTITVAAKRCLLMERTGLEKSVSVALLKKGP